MTTLVRVTVQDLAGTRLTGSGMIGRSGVLRGTAWIGRLVPETNAGPWDEAVIPAGPAQWRPLSGADN